ncbi:PIN domain-containing protein [Oscillospiraceae bacterium 38-13]
MAVYMIDTENIPHAWVKLLELYEEGDRFVLFYTDHVAQFPISVLQQVAQTPAELEFVHCYSGPNGLDFQLVSEMGFRVATRPDERYIIVSGDHGFDAVIDYWGERDVEVKRVVPSVGSAVYSEVGRGGEVEVRDAHFTNPQSIKDFLCWKLSNKVPQREVSFIAGLLMEAMDQGNGYSADRRLSCRFTYLDRSLRKQYGDEKGSKLRDQIKAVSREAFILGFQMEETVEPEAVPETAPEAVPETAPAAAPEVVPEPPAPEEKVYARLLPLGLPEDRTRKVSDIVEEVLESGEQRRQALVYRRILAAFGRKDGTELYRAVKAETAQLILERQQV